MAPSEELGHESRLSEGAERDDPALESLRRKRDELQDLFRRYGVPQDAAPRLLSEALLAIGSESGGAPPRGSRLLRAVELVSARWAAERETGDADTAGEGPGADGPESFSGILLSVSQRLDARRHGLLQEQEAAAGLLEELLPLSAEERRPLAAEARFQTWAVADRALDTAWRWCPNQPSRALALSLWVGELAERLDESVYGDAALKDLQARAKMSTANARRVMRDFAAAGSDLEAAEALLEQGSLDPRLRADLLRLLSALRRNQSQLPEAERLLDNALAIYRWIGDTHEQGRATLSKALILNRRGDCEESLELVREALELIDIDRDPRLTLVALHNMGFQYANLGRYDEAERLLPLLEELCENDGGELDHLRVEWLAGVVALAKGDASGESTLLAVRQQFIDLGMVLDAVVVSMEVVAFYLAQGRIADTRHLADEMVALLASLPATAGRFNREAMAAVLAFQQAARMENATLSLMRDAHGSLRRSLQGQASDAGSNVPSPKKPS